ncbi:hypothetical protein PMKS-001725 [Pichia membranifaciens]|uniref:Uncharacterized protein n=1 Tax=Pichia membranifaciens TaxID=4926 RepID=A0A1Q2YFJ3_9ASCO|nr:hypothetical protein PMKS-001725 [Pichia membranifaciens]
MEKLDECVRIATDVAHKVAVRRVTGEDSAAETAADPKGGEAADREGQHGIGRSVQQVQEEKTDPGAAIQDSET